MNNMNKLDIFNFYWYNRKAEENAKKKDFIFE